MIAVKLLVFVFLRMLLPERRGIPPFIIWWSEPGPLSPSEDLKCGALGSEFGITVFLEMK
jgi:hypothetical protein